MDSDHDLQTRVTALEELRVPLKGQDCLVVIYAPTKSELGRRYALEGPSLNIGRGRDNDIVLISDCISRRHARIERRADGIHIIDLDSTNGTYVNDEPQPVKGARLLGRGDQLKVGDFIFKYLSGSDVEAQYHEIIFSMTVTDGLTNVSNKRQLDNVLSREITRLQRQPDKLSLLMFDIDHFKQVNDTHGHLAGDSVLRILAGLLRKRLRPGDDLGRYGGEEFCAILPGTSLQSALAIGEELRRLVEMHPFSCDGKRLQLTMSVGVSSWHPGMEMKDFYQAADEMLYLAKRSGRNRVCPAA